MLATAYPLAIIIGIGKISYKHPTIPEESIALYI